MPGHRSFSGRLGCGQELPTRCQPETGVSRRSPHVGRAANTELWWVLGHVARGAPDMGCLPNAVDEGLGIGQASRVGSERLWYGVDDDRLDRCRARMGRHGLAGLLSPTGQGTTVTGHLPARTSFTPRDPMSR
jgi:hypothetical protein